ncbi:MAG: DUF2508 family protein [Aminipila sp.]
MVQFSTLTQTAEKLYKKLMGIKPELTENDAIILSLHEVKNKLARSERNFNEITDNDLIDYATYDILAEKARYAHLLKQAKKRNLHF